MFGMKWDLGWHKIFLWWKIWRMVELSLKTYGLRCRNKEQHQHLLFSNSAWECLEYNSFEADSNESEADPIRDHTDV